MAHKHNLCGRFANPLTSRRVSVSQLTFSLSLTFNKGSSSRGWKGTPIFLFSETVALPFPFLTFHLNSLTRRSSNPPPLSDDRISGGSCGWNRSSYESRQNNSQEPSRWPASHLRRNKFQRRNSETPEEEGVICYRRKRLGRKPRKKRGGGGRTGHNLPRPSSMHGCYNLFNAAVRIEFVN